MPNAADPQHPAASAGLAAELARYARARTIAIALADWMHVRDMEMSDADHRWEIRASSGAAEG